MQENFIQMSIVGSLSSPLEAWSTGHTERDQRSDDR
jgi:hypothetical protein